VSGDPDRYDADTPYVLTSMGGADSAWTFIIDREGRVVWARESARQTATLHPRVSRDGADLLIDEGTWWATFDAEGGEVIRMKIDGSQGVVYETPGLHHPFTDTIDGSILWGAISDGGADELLQELAADGSRRTLWGCRAFLAEIGAGPGNGCGSNTLYWDEAGDRLLFSLYSIETVIEIDRASGESLRWFGHAAGAWSFDPPESAFWWQHGGYFTDEGHLLISSDRSDAGEETVVREYRLDEATETLVEVWSFGLGEGVYGEVMGEPHRLPGGNTLHNYGGAARLREATPDGEVVWDVDWDTDYIGRSAPIADLYALAP